MPRRNCPRFQRCCDQVSPGTGLAHRPSPTQAPHGGAQTAHDLHALSTGVACSSESLEKSRVDTECSRVPVVLSTPPPRHRLQRTRRSAHQRWCFLKGRSLRAPYPDVTEQLPSPLLLAPSPRTRAPEYKASCFLRAASLSFSRMTCRLVTRTIVLGPPCPQAHPSRTGSPRTFLRSACSITTGLAHMPEKTEALLLLARMGDRDQTGFALPADRTKVENKIMNVCSHAFPSTGRQAPRRGLPEMHRGLHPPAHCPQVQALAGRDQEEP